MINTTTATIVRMIIISLSSALVKKSFSTAAPFDAVLIDEFQDINDYQNELFEFFYDSKKIECTFVGDDDQSIYFWRGSNNEIIRI